MSYGEAIRDLRLELGLTQKDLAKRIGKAFVTVNRWENDKIIPSRESAKDIIEIAKKSGATDVCISRLYSELLPSVKRIASAKNYGFPEIDRNFLFGLADDSVNGLYVVDAKTYKLIYINRKAEEYAAAHLRDIGENIKSRTFSEHTNKLCYHFFCNSDVPCSDCPLKNLSRQEYKDRVVHFPETGKTYQTHAKISKIANRDVYVVYLTDITDNNAEQNSLYEMINDIPIAAGIYAVYPDFRIELEFMNTVLLQMIDEERQRALMKNEGFDFCSIYPEDRPRFLMEMKEAVIDNLNTKTEFRMRIADRKYHRIRLTTRLLKSNSEKRIYYCLFHVLDDESDAQKSNEKEENQMDSVMEQLRAWGCDVDGAMKRMLDDESFYLECLETIPNDENFEQLSKALKDKNAKAAFDSAHTLKGLFANLGLTPMLNKNNEIVEPLRGGSCEGLEEKFKQLSALNDYLAAILHMEMKAE